MRVLMLSKACIVGIYQRKLEAIAQRGIELLALVPPSWKDERGETKLERVYTSGYRLETTPIWFNGNFHLHYYPQLGHAIRDFQPDIIHIDEEPYNLATWHALVHAHGAKTLFFSWQNLYRRYPPPFNWGEQWALRQVDYAIMGTDSAAAIWREKGYAGPLRVIPQFGVDPDLFHSPAQPSHHPPFTIGYFGRLVEEKGLVTLIDAAARLPDPDWYLRFVGSGSHKTVLEERAHDLSLSNRVQFCDYVPSTQMPALYHELDVFVLPSRTRRNWMEQFGRVLVEAMASGVPVIGSDSGAIPDVVGDAGLIFPEGDTAALTTQLDHLQHNSALRAQLARTGRARVLDHFTNERVAAETVAVYEEMIGR
jgi:glycosyltransferase involved in cell wall biosynthesis